LEAVAVDEHVIEAASAHVPGTLSHRDELWNQCYEQSMAWVCTRLEQEIARLGGNFAHVLAELVESQHDEPTNES